MSVDTISSLFTSGAYLPAAILLIYGLLRLVKDETHWLNNGRVAVIVAAVLGSLTDIIPVVASGKVPDAKVWLYALMTAVGLYLKPEQTQKAAA